MVRMQPRLNFIDTTVLAIISLIHRLLTMMRMRQNCVRGGAESFLNAWIT